MNVIWAKSTGNHVFDVVAAVGQALNETKQAMPAAVPTEDLFMGDTYLAENVGLMRSSFELHPWGIVSAGPGLIGQTLELGQRLVRRLTWWYLQPQTTQASQFNAAVVRAMDALLARVLRLAQRIHQLESAHSELRLRGLEEQLRTARNEQTALLLRVTQLEATLEAVRTER